MGGICLTFSDKHIIKTDYGFCIEIIPSHMCLHYTENFLVDNDTVYVANSVYREKKRRYKSNLYERTKRAKNKILALYRCNFYSSSYNPFNSFCVYYDYAEKTYMLFVGNFSDVEDFYNKKKAL